MWQYGLTFQRCRLLESEFNGLPASLPREPVRHLRMGNPAVAVESHLFRRVRRTDSAKHGCLLVRRPYLARFVGLRFARHQDA